MVAGGTGITPFFQLIQEIGNDAKENLELHLLFCNKSVV
jgi:predicted ferric reductase